MMKDKLIKCRSCGISFVCSPVAQRSSVPGELPAVCPGCCALAAISGPRQGRIKWYDARRGFGFIKEQGGEDVFLHVSEVGRQKDRLRKGIMVRYLVEMTERGAEARQIRFVGRSQD